MVRAPSRGCTCLKCTNRAKSIFSHGIHRTHRTSCCVYSPTDFTDLHRWLGCLQGGALVSSAPTKQEVHQCSQVGALETSAPPEISSFCENPCNLWEVIPSKQKQSVGASSQPPFLASLQILRVIPCGARRVGRQVQTGSRQVQGENIVHYCTESAAIGAESVIIPPRNV